MEGDFETEFKTKFIRNKRQRVSCINSLCLFFLLLTLLRFKSTLLKALTGSPTSELDSVKVLAAGLTPTPLDDDDDAPLLLRAADWLPLVDAAS